MLLDHLSAGTSDPTLESLTQLSPTSVRVRWSHPSDMAPVSSYLVSYSPSTVDATATRPNISPSETSFDLTHLTQEETYTIHVEAVGGEGVLGTSEKLTITLRILSEYFLCNKKNRGTFL